MRPISLAVPMFSLALLGCDGDPRRSVTSPQLDIENPGPGPSASGHGNWINSFGEYVTRSFHAREQEPGVVTGSWVYHFTSPTGEKRENMGDVNCLRIIAPNEAVISGIIRVNMNPDLIGQVQIFRVVDNGEGSGELEDRLSALYNRSPDLRLDCNNFTPPTTTPIESGNLQVKP